MCATPGRGTWRKWTSPQAQGRTLSAATRERTLGIRRAHLSFSPGVPVTYFSMGGWFYGITCGPELKNVFTRMEQFWLARDPRVCLALARKMIMECCAIFRIDCSCGCIWNRQLRLWQSSRLWRTRRFRQSRSRSCLKRRILSSAQIRTSAIDETDAGMPEKVVQVYLPTRWATRRFHIL